MPVKSNKSVRTEPCRSAKHEFLEVPLNKTFPNAGLAYAVQQTFDGGFIIAGSKGAKALLIKTDVNGDTGERTSFP
jgi:hypothetical protein